MTYHDWNKCLPPDKPHKHPGGHTDLRNDPRHIDGQDDGGWVNGARGITQRSRRTSPTKQMANLHRRQAGHISNPPMADGSQFGGSKPKGKFPGSLSGRKH